MELKKPYYPACVIAVLIALLFGIFTICQVYLLKDNYPVSKLWVGSDYIAFYNATNNLVRGVSVYENIWLSVPDYLKQMSVDLKIMHHLDNDNSSWYCYPAYTSVSKLPA